MTRSLVGAVFLAVVAAATTACGGTNSETPFPLEPDFRRLDGGPPSSGRYVVFSGSDRDAAKSEDENESEDEESPDSREAPAE